MPLPGDQHNVAANPFEEVKPRISEFTATEIATLQARLEKQLGPEYISSRSGPSGQKVHYIAAEKCIALANEVFGFNGWSSSIQNIQVDFVDEHPQTLKISLGLSVVVRVTLRDGTFHEDIGYGHIENCKGKAAAFEKAKKEGTTDGLKRALRNFGNVLGNCIYDKDYLAKVTKIKVAPTKFDEGNLHRHVDYAPKESAPKREVNTDASKTGQLSLLPQDTIDSLDDDFGDFDMADFGVTEDEHPDEVVLPVTNGGASKPQDRPQGAVNTGNGFNRSTSSNFGPSKPMQPPNQAPMSRSSSYGQQARPQPQTPQAANRPGPTGQSRPQVQPNGRANGPAPAQVSAAQAAANSRINTPPPANGTDQVPDGPVAFFSARSVTALAEDAPPGTATLPPKGGKLFDPKLESPSIRKTPGIDHGSSKPVGKDKRHAAPIKHDEEQPSTQFGGGAGKFNPPGRTSLGNVINPSLNQARQIGAPGSQSPMANRNQYRPPTMKRPADGGSRAPLNEMTTNGSVAVNATNTDAKRQKVG
ncbi:DNA repair and recombination protein rhm52 [Pestalotiopsis sp. NC0098]|nr:DNA repair and recombination protein rhm52 [Pestalotiopsis sp. NC0098]